MATVGAGINHQPSTISPPVPPAFQYERYPEIVRRIERTRGQRKRVLVAHGILSYIALVLALLLASCGFEAVVHFSDAVRKAMLAGFVLVILGGAGVLVFRPLFDEWTNEQIALFVETAYPQIRNGLINSLRLAKADVVVSPPMVNEAIKEAALESGQYDFSKAIDRGPLVRSGWAAGIMVVLAIVSAVLWPQRFGNSLNRILKPASEVPALGDIKIEKVDPGDTAVISGDDLVVTAEITNPSGRSIDGVLIYRPDEGDERTQIMSPRSEVLFGCDIPGVKIPFKYRVVIGGSESRWYRARVVDEPRVVGIDFRFVYPQYSGLPPETIKNSDGNIKALTGTVVDMTVRVNKELAKALVRIDDKKDIPLQIGPGGTTLQLAERMAVTQDGTYSVQIQDTEGYTNRNPITYYIRAVPDDKPVLKFGAPGKDTTVGLGGRVQIGLKVTDDYGIATVQLLAKRTNEDAGEESEEEVVKAWTEFPDAKNASLAYDWQFPKDRFKIGDTVTYYAKATDNLPGDAPNVAQSAKYKIQIKDMKAEKATKQKEYFEWRKHVEKALDEQKKARQKTDALLKALGVNTDGKNE